MTKITLIDFNKATSNYFKIPERNQWKGRDFARIATWPLGFIPIGILYLIGRGIAASCKPLEGRVKPITTNEPPQDTQNIAFSTLQQSTKSSHSTNPASPVDVEGLPVASLPKLENFVDVLKNERGVRVKGGESDTWHEIVFDDKPYNKEQVKCTWKLHISPGSDTMAVLDAIKPILIKSRPYCKIVQNQERLTDLQQSLDVNDKHVYKGKCLTIYPKSNEEALELAKELNKAINQSKLINLDNSQKPCTDRPLGSSGYLWSRNDLAGGPIDEMSMKSADHAHAMPGNYDTTIILPMKAYDFETDPRGRKEYIEWYNTEFPTFPRIKQTDIFEKTFGAVRWVGTPKSDQGHFETL